MSGCVSENTVARTVSENMTVCTCHIGYYGKECSESWSWYRPIMMTVYIIELIIVIFSLVWSLIHFRELKKKSRLRPNLSTVGLGLSSLGFVLRLAYIVMPSRSVWGNIEPAPVTLVNVVLVYSVTCAWLTTCLLALGFWHDALTHKLKPQLKTRTKYIIIAISLIFLILTITGMVIILNGQILPGTFCILIPTFIVIVVMIVYTIKIKHMRGQFSITNAMRKRWIEDILSALCALWSFYFFALILYPIMSIVGKTDLIIIPSALYRILESAIAPLLVAIFDTRCLSLRNVSSKIKLDQKFDGTSNTPQSTENPFSTTANRSTANPATPLPSLDSTIV